MAWSSLAVQFYFNIEEARIENESVAVRLIDFFSYFTIETNLFIALVLTVYCHIAASGTRIDQVKRSDGACCLYYRRWRRL